MPARDGDEHDEEDGDARASVEGSPRKRGGWGSDRYTIDGTRKRMRPSLEVKNEKEAKKMLTSTLVKGLKVWVFNSKELWPLNSARKLKAGGGVTHCGCSGATWGRAG